MGKANPSYTLPGILKIKVAHVLLQESKTLAYK